MDALEHLKSLSYGSIPMSKLEEAELDEYCQRLAIMDAKNEGESVEKKEGIKEGIKEGKIETAKNMLKDGFDIDFVFKYTNLSIKEIKDLANKI